MSHLAAVKQRYDESFTAYVKRFRETRNRCYDVSLGERDLAEMVFAGLSSYLREKLEGLDPVDVNQVMQRAITCEARARENR